MAKNKLQKFADMDTYNHVFQYPFAVLKERGFDMRGKWNEQFFHNDNPIVLELGCGKGEYAVGLARRYPNKNFIGVDIKGARMWSGASEALAEGIENVAFLRTHIELITHFFAPGEVSEIWITFPDPQMKKTRKRLTSTRMIELYREILAENGIIHLKSDSPFLYTYTRAMVQENRFPVLVDTDDLYNSGIDDDILSIKTFYEQQWLERGKSIKYIKFVCEPRETLIEPDIEIELDDYRSFNRSKRSSKTTNKE
ncbi:MAG: tRNA (guanosine(46)-N7)-methyltransferase TrmB [Bacteroidaceae bacterium]|nr:tRNA (guanosine(46)-N7)-methyltransferase TrmB [Bacteroidales bacterium]MBQ2980479.1 tRNA (guanosine(46)-N7)-methyltransferase TrmB [Bacteroidaceae bacterium]